ncbi:MAG: hypothetical protein M0Z71_07835 [Nitrospiraceae bacterium]|nr:hypothetical protein [Nitrospiraceae bacterium]
MTNIFDILTDKYDAWYDSEEGRPRCRDPMSLAGLRSRSKATSTARDSSA